MDQLRKEIRSAFARQQAPLGDAGQVQARIMHKVRADSKRKRSPVLRLVGVGATLVIAGGVATVILLTHSHVHARTETAQVSLEQALTSGPAAFVTSTTSRAFVWLTGPIINPSPATGPGSGQVTGLNVEVLDWTGVVRYRFQLPKPAVNVPLGIQAISADGTRALLDDGTVLDQTGAVLGHITALETSDFLPAVRWMNDDRSLCAAFSNEPVGPFASPPPTKGQPNASPTATPAYMALGADHSVTLKIFGLDSVGRTVATVGSGPLSVPSGAFGDSVGVLACNATNDLAVVARYHDADITPADAQSSTNMTVSLWAIKLSNGEVLFHQPETRMALGVYFYGSQDARLAVERLWNAKVSGCETDAVLHIPSGKQVPVLDSEPCPDTTAVSADGTRILRRIVYVGSNKTALELIDASTGGIIRRVEAATIFGASAVAEPGGSSFIVQVDRYFALVDASGGITLLHPDVVLNQGGPGGVSLPYGSQG